MENMRPIGWKRKLAAVVVPAACVVAAVALAATSSAATMAGHRVVSATRQSPTIGHVFVIVLENQSYPGTFGDPSADRYLAKTLPAQGALLTQYFGTAHESNANYIAMVSGQGPNPQNQADCQIYSDFVGGGPAIVGGQAVGSGCVYPTSVQTVGNQLTENGLSWKGYLQDMGNVPARESAACAHPALGSRDGTQTAGARAR
jgi:hypothetical protein